MNKDELLQRWQETLGQIAFCADQLHHHEAVSVADYGEARRFADLLAACSSLESMVDLVADHPAGETSFIHVAIHTLRGIKSGLVVPGDMPADATSYQVVAWGVIEMLDGLETLYPEGLTLYDEPAQQ